MNLPNPLLTIARRFLTVSLDTFLFDVLSKMNQIKAGYCNLSEAGEINPVETYTNFPVKSDFSHYMVTTCALILEENKLIGIITERDVVNLVVQGQNLAVPVAAVMTKQVITLNESEFTDVFIALSLLRKNQIRHLPIVNETEKVVGIVTPETIRSILQPVNLLTMRRVAEIMTRKVIHASVKTSVLNLARMMVKYRVSCVAIVSYSPTKSTDFPMLIPLGIVTERDIVQLQILGLDMENIQAETVMSQPLFCLQPEDSLWVAHQEMQRRFVRRLVVTGERGEIIGIITQSNIVRALEPVELYGVIDTLQQVLDKQTTELIQANEQLKLQTQEVQKALQKEQEINELKSQFIYIISHDFRNPITSIISLANLLEIYGQQISEDKKSQYLNCIGHSANRMLQMVEALLIVGKSDAGKLELNLFFLQLKFFCQELVSEFRLYEASQHNLTFSYQGETDAEIYCDEDMLRYILNNLLSNALKYSPIQSEVNLSVYVESDRAIFQVKDTGIGIPLEYRQHLFKSFHRANNVGNIPGTGLGLAIVKKYVDLLNGEIKVESEVNVGTTFTVTLPLNN